MGYSQDSLSYYLEIAALNNPGIKAKYLEYSAALEKLPQVASLPDPELQFGYFIKPMELLGGNQVADIRLMQMFPWFGTLKAAKDEASKMAVMKFESFQDAKNELYFNVKVSYYKVYRTKKEIEISKKNLDILHTLKQLAMIKFRAGDISSSLGAGSSMSSVLNNSFPSTSGIIANGMPNQSNTGTGSMSVSSNAPVIPTSSASMSSEGKGDMVNLLGVQIEILALENRIALLKDQLATDKLSINRFLNRSSSSEVFLNDSITETPIPADFFTLADSISNHPMIKMYEAESEANAAKLTMVTRMGYPMVGLGLDYSLIQKREGNTSMMNGQDMIMPMVSLTLPIYREKYKAMQREAEFMRDAAKESMENAQNDLHVDFQQTMQNLNDADRRVKLYTVEAMIASKSVQLLITSFSVSRTDFEEVLRMQQQLLDYQVKQVEAIVDKNTSIARLVYLTGK